jgi:hypothetical protein
MPLPARLALDEITQQSGIEHPKVTPFTHITATLVVWNDQERLGQLLSWIRPYFARIVVGVQDSEDDSLSVARELADTVVEDRHSGFGDSTYGPKVLSLVTSPWALKLDCDEWPSTDLLDSLSSATWMCEQDRDTFDGAWLPFRSSVDGVEYEEQHAHLRLFRAHLGWPAMLHSTPPTNRTLLWHTGHIRHDRTLDEMMRDYLNYWRVGLGNKGWEAHNRSMMYHACLGTAGVRGWDYVRSFTWWPEVEAIAFKEEKPWQQP